MLTSLNKVKNALLRVTDACYHYHAPTTATDKYIVWAEDASMTPLLTDNQIPAHVIEGTIDYFTKSEHDETIAKIPAALNAAGVGWSLNSVQYEDETRFHHYEWLFQVIQDYSGVTL